MIGGGREIRLHIIWFLVYAFVNNAMKTCGKRILLITPPLLQPNTPYPATAVLAGFLKSHNISVTQTDISIQLLRKVFCKEGISHLVSICSKKTLTKTSPSTAFFLSHHELYINTIEPVIKFLAGENPELAHRIVQRSFLPEGPHFAELELSGTNLSSYENLERLFGCAGIHDQAKLIASLYLDDIATVISESCDNLFSFSRYAEHLATSAPSLDPIISQLQNHFSWITQLVDSITTQTIAENRPDIIGITIPFPGTLFFALHIAKFCRKNFPAIKIVLGGGYVNTELRSLEDDRIFDFAHQITFDEGFAPMLGVVGAIPPVRTLTKETLAHRDEIIAQKSPVEIPAIIEPDYNGLDMSLYFDITETANPMQRIWSEGKWLKLQLANGCYWGKCAFCDVSLDYIARFNPPNAQQILDTMVSMKRKTGRSSFHFTDEAIPPTIARKLSQAIISSGETFVWWGNIRFEKTFSADLCRLMAQAGCIAVTGGLECANDRLLKLMNKGITLDSAKNVLRNFANAGILTHAYLMYGFPTQTKKETMSALRFVRDRIAEGSLNSAFWHRFALTTHSPIARTPDAFNISILPSPPVPKRFAENELFFKSKTTSDINRIGKILSHATYNYMQGLGLDEPVSMWERMLAE